MSIEMLTLAVLFVVVALLIVVIGTLSKVNKNIGKTSCDAVKPVVAKDDPKHITKEDKPVACGNKGKKTSTTKKGGKK